MRISASSAISTADILVYPAVTPCPHLVHCVQHRDRSARSKTGSYFVQYCFSADCILGSALHKCYMKVCDGVDTVNAFTACTSDVDLPKSSGEDCNNAMPVWGCHKCSKTHTLTVPSESQHSVAFEQQQTHSFSFIWLHCKSCEQACESGWRLLIDHWLCPFTYWACEPLLRLS